MVGHPPSLLSLFVFLNDIFHHANESQTSNIRMGLGIIFQWVEQSPKAKHSHIPRYHL